MSASTDEVRAGTRSDKVTIEYGVHLRYRKPRGGERRPDKIAIESEEDARARIREIKRMASMPQYSSDVLSATLVTRTKTIVVEATEWQEVDSAQSAK